MQTQLNDNPAYKFYRTKGPLVQHALDLARALAEPPYALVLVDRDGAAMLSGLFFSEMTAVHQATDGASCAVVPFERLGEHLGTEPEAEAIRQRLASHVPSGLPPLLVVAGGEFFFFDGGPTRGQA